MPKGTKKTGKAAEPAVPAELAEPALRKRAPKVTPTTEQQIELLEYIRPRYKKLYGPFVPGHWEKKDRLTAQKKLFAHAGKIGYKVRTLKDLLRNLCTWKKLAVDAFNYRSGTGGGPPKPLSEVQNMFIEIMCQNRKIGRGAERVSICFL